MMLTGLLIADISGHGALAALIASTESGGAPREVWHQPNYSGGNLSLMVCATSSIEVRRLSCSISRSLAIF